MELAASGGFLKKLEAVYAEMDRAYDRSAAYHGFSCTPCTENCCLTRFYHHTTIEFAYLLHGFDGLSRETQDLCLTRAETYNREMERAASTGGAFSHMCPVNENGLCMVYAFRPMICRLHGIPHEVNPPGRGKVFGSGCMAFEKSCGAVSCHGFDRTPFYMEMAELEQAFRREVNITEKFKMTVAGMLLFFRESET